MRRFRRPSASTQKILHNARMAEAGVITRDPIRESIGLELDVFNILCVLHFFPYLFSLTRSSNSIRLVQLLARSGNNRK